MGNKKNVEMAIMEKYEGYVAQILSNILNIMVYNKIMEAGTAVTVSMRFQFSWWCEVRR